MHTELPTPDLFAAARGYANAEPQPGVEAEPRPVRSGVGGVLPPVLDVCCGPRGMWFDKRDARAVFCDRRRETINMEYPSGSYTEVIDPDVVADFTALPFPDESFRLVVMDPPHIEQAEASGRIVKRYGHLFADWRGMLERGFAECFRVLKPEGVFVFKWNECRIPVSEVLALTPERPLFGHQSGKTMQTHWIAFMKHDRLKGHRLDDPAAQAMAHWIEQQKQVDEHIAAQRSSSGGGGAEQAGESGASKQSGASSHTAEIRRGDLNATINPQSESPSPASNG